LQRFVIRQVDVVRNLVVITDAVHDGMSLPRIGRDLRAGEKQLRLR
jgi:hypothetical protein